MTQLNCWSDSEIDDVIATDSCPQGIYLTYDALDDLVQQLKALEPAIRVMACASPEQVRSKLQSRTITHI